MQSPWQVSDEAAGFLPNFCDVRIVFAVIIMAELLAFVITLADSRAAPEWWTVLSLTSLYIQWISLTGATMLCVLRRPLNGLGTVRTALYSYLALLAGGTVVAEATWQLGTSFQLPIILEQPSHHQFLWRTLAVTAIAGLVALRYFYLQDQLQRNVRAEAKMRFHALQARIQPHFLFNSMNTVASLTRSDPELAEDVILDLAELFRFILKDERDQISLAEEMELCRRYLHIEQLRLGERLRTDLHADGLPPDFTLPALTLQPLLENAVYHGVAAIPDGGTVRLTGRVTRNAVEIEVRNPLPPEGQEAAPGHRMALENLRQRLAACFGPDARLQSGPLGADYVVRLTLPRGYDESTVSRRRTPRPRPLAAPGGGN